MLATKDIVRFLFTAILLVIVLMSTNSKMSVLEVVAVATIFVIIVVTIEVGCSALQAKIDTFAQFQVPNCSVPDMKWATRTCRDPDNVVPRNATMENFELTRSNYVAPYASEMPFIPYNPDMKPLANYDPSKFTNDFQYVTQPPEYYEPLGKANDTLRFDFNHGYSYLNTDKWTVPQRHPEMCIRDVRANVCPIEAPSSYLGVGEFFDAQRTKLNYGINTRYIQDKLNA